MRNIRGLALTGKSAIAYWEVMHVAPVRAMSYERSGFLRYTGSLRWTMRLASCDGHDAAEIYTIVESRTGREATCGQLPSRRQFGHSDRRARA